MGAGLTETSVQALVDCLLSQAELGHDTPLSELTLHVDGNDCEEEGLTAVVEAACRLPQLAALTAGFGPHAP